MVSQNADTLSPSYPPNLKYSGQVDRPAPSAFPGLGTLQVVRGSFPRVPTQIPGCTVALRDLVAPTKFSPPIPSPHGLSRVLHTRITRVSYISCSIPYSIASIHSPSHGGISTIACVEAVLSVTLRNTSLQTSWKGTVLQMRQ